MGCTTDNNNIREFNHDREIPLTLVERVSPKVCFNLIGSLGGYEKMLDTTMTALFFHEIKYGKNEEQTFRDVTYRNSGVDAPENFINRIRINGIDPLQTGDTQNFFGEKLRITSEKSQPISLQSTGVEFEPISSIQILSPDVSQSVLCTPLCDASNFLVCWNSDSTNTNGVIIGIRWTGIMLFGDDYPKTEVVNLETFPDTGVATLSNGMFENIPDTALCELIVLRGNAETITLDNVLIRVISESTDIIQVVIAKNIIYEEESALCELN